MAHTKSGGSTKLGRDSESKRLGIKCFAGERVLPGFVLARQRGTRYAAGRGVRKGADDTIYAARAGLVSFREKTKSRFDGSKRKISVVEVIEIGR